MTCDPHASLHLGLSAEAMALIGPQLGDRPTTGFNGQGLLLPMIASIALLMLLPGARTAQEGGLRPLARAMDCASRRNEPPIIAAPAPVLSR